MQINISTRHGHISEATQAKISAKLERLPRLFERLTAIEVTVDLEHKEKEQVQVDLQVSAEHKHDFLATEKSSDVMSSLDGAIHKVEQQLRKYKEKVQDHHKSPGLRQQGAASNLESTGD